MNNYKVKKEDLIGCLEKIPIPVVQRMLAIQVEQGNQEDITVFQRNLDTPKRFGGFNWNETNDEGTKFWARIINYKDYRGFFEKYRETLQINNQNTSKDEESIIEEIIEAQEEFVQQIDNSIKVGDTIIATNFAGVKLKDCKRKRILIAILPDSEYPYLGMTEDALSKLKQGKSSDISAYKYVQKEDEIPQYIELTLKDISEGKGVGINPELIKIIK